MPKSTLPSSSAKSEKVFSILFHRGLIDVLPFFSLTSWKMLARTE